MTKTNKFFFKHMSQFSCEQEKEKADAIKNSLSEEREKKERERKKQYFQNMKDFVPLGSISMIQL